MDNIIKYGINKHLYKIAKNFPYMKFELEANFTNMQDGDSECYDCEGCGTWYDHESECDMECETCGGSGNSEGSYADLEQYVLNNIPDLARENLSYCHAYNDQSVNTELTFTIKTEYAYFVPTIIQKFLDYADDYDTDGAGFHISVLTDEGGRYPCRTDFDEHKIDNFKQSVNKLLPALIYAGSDQNTRGLFYRQPRLSADKYSAIHIGYGFMEYRLFDPIWKQGVESDKFISYIKIIANTLTYYSDLRLTTKLYDKFQVEKVDTETHSPIRIDKLYKSLDNYIALRKTLPLIDPDKVSTIKEPSAKQLAKLKYAREIKAIKNWQNYLASRYETMQETRLQLWKRCHRYITEAQKLSDLDKLTAREYIDITSNREYRPDIFCNLTENEIKDVTPKRFLELYRSHNRPYDEAYNLEHFMKESNLITITG